MNEILRVFCYGPSDWRVEGCRPNPKSAARCTTREAAEAARRLLSGECERAHRPVPHFPCKVGDCWCASED